ncbi:sodium-dependent neutral amino acid transporter B(0)AT3-like isoform X2 [Clytia hemisphaerica]|uniref:Transporter n=1 Tax=Clytia hemisphaerica TaxID=252671 RepID=A0A7M5XG10_9CNID
MGRKLSENDEKAPLDAALKDEDLDRMLDEEESREAWGNKVEFLLASVGLAVGVGNVWRFPYLCQKNGGGAFLIPYFTMMVLQGFPLFIMEFAMGQRMKQSAVRCWNNVHPVFFGVGISCMLVSFAMCSYYIVVITWCLYYFFVSFTSDLPWQRQYCGKYKEYTALQNNISSYIQSLRDSNATMGFIYNETLRTDSEIKNFPDCCVVDPPQYFWYHNALQTSPLLERADHMNWKIFGCLAAGWFVVYLCVLKGVKSSGKAAYFTATFPYVLLFILFIRGVTLEGAGDGIKEFFRPKMSEIWKFQAWMDAATQIFYSLSIGFGALIAFSSYMPRKNNCVNDALIVVLINCGTSLFAGIVTFSFLGYRQHKTGIEIEKIGTGPGLAFITYCEAFLLMEVSPLWSILFFMMLVLLGIDSEFGTLEGAVAPLYDLGWVTMRKEYFMAIIGGVFVVLEMIFCLGNGYYLFQIFDDYSVPVPLLIIALFQVVALGWVYGTDRISNDIEYMTGKRPHIFWRICWKYISPLILIVVFFGYIVSMISETPTYRAYVGCEQDPFNPEISEGSEHWWKKFKYPWWAQLFAAILVLISVLPIPYYFIKNWPKGGFTKIKEALSNPAIYYPDPSWKEPERRLGHKEMEKLIRDEDRELLRKSLEAGKQKVAV